MLRLLLFLAVIVVVTGCVPKQKTLSDNYLIIAEGEAPWVISHGGAKQLWPENTMLAFENSMVLGVDMLEMDVCITKDEVLVCHHDLTIDRMSDGEGAVSEYSYDELLIFNFGDGFEGLDGKNPYQDTLIPILKLQDLIDRFSGIPMTIEIKNEGDLGIKAADLLYDMIVSKSLTNSIVIASFHDEVLKHLKKKSNKEALLSTGKGKTTRFVLSSKAFLNSVHFPYGIVVQIPVESSGFDLATERTVRSAHKHNVAVHYWTLNTKEEIHQAIDIGADGIITDRPDLMKEVLTEMGY